MTRPYNPLHSIVIIRFDPIVAKIMTTIECKVWALPVSLAATQGISCNLRCT